MPNLAAAPPLEIDCRRDQHLLDLEPLPSRKPDSNIVVGSSVEHTQSNNMSGTVVAINTNMAVVNWDAEGTHTESLVDLELVF